LAHVLHVFSLSAAICVGDQEQIASALTSEQIASALASALPSRGSA